MTFSLAENEKRLLLRTARESIDARLTGRVPRLPPRTPALETPCGAFVTLRKKGELRGCIGHITATRALAETVADVALSSAFNDPRFAPLTLAEWGEVSIEISVLSPFERIADPGIVQAGVHGVMVSRGHRSGLLLPQVATEQGWDRETLLVHTCYKAGLAGDAWRDADTRIEVFTALVFQENDA